jgi:DNA repair protein RadC
MNQSNVAALYMVTEVELIYRNYIDPENRVNVSNATAAYNVLYSSWNKDRINLVEQFKILLLDVRNNCLAICDIASGGLDQCSIDPRLVYATALTAKASKIIAAHNHPSGNLKPSDSDVAFTLRLVEGCKLLGMQCVEHIILTPQGYYSFADNGLIP